MKVLIRPAATERKLPTVVGVGLVKFIAAVAGLLHQLSWFWTVVSLSSLRQTALIHSFLPRDAMLARYMLSSCVRPFVCPSVTRRCCAKTAKHRITQITSYDSSTTQFSGAKDLGEITTYGVTPTGAPSRGGVGLYRRFSTNISLSQKRCKIGT